MHTFIYVYSDPSGQMTIDTASWEILHLEPALEELRICIAQKTFDIILGSGFVENFIYIPARGLGFATADLENTEQNLVHLTKILAYQEACAIASALRDYVSYPKAKY